MNSSEITELMQRALREAHAAFCAGEVPVGAVIAHKGEIIASARNEIEGRKDATAHAELLAIREAAKRLNNWRLADSVLCVTLEPCPMCISAIRLSRIPLVVFGASDEKMGAVGSLFDLAADERLGRVPRVISGICAAESSELLKRFFLERRAGAFSASPLS